MAKNVTLDAGEKLYAEGVTTISPRTGDRRHVFHYVEGAVRDNYGFVCACGMSYADMKAARFRPRVCPATFDELVQRLEDLEERWRDECES